MLKRICKAICMNPLDRLLKKAASENKNRFLVIWNRGLGDIPLGLYGLIFRIRRFIPHASVTFLTRPDLVLGFAFLENIHVLSCSHWQRGNTVDVAASLEMHQLTPDLYDVILENPDLTRWLKWQIGTITPKLKWQDKWDILAERYQLQREETYIGIHVDTETGMYYGYEKNWPLTRWQELFIRIRKENKGKIILFGMRKEPAFLIDHLIDLRGDTSICEVLSIIKNYCRYLIAPDSGILSMIYYLKSDFPLKVVSLWSDPRQGILRQNVPSPNQQLQHIPLIGKNDNVANISSLSVYHGLFDTDGKKRASFSISKKNF